MNTSYYEIVNLTEEEKKEMYSKLTKEELISFIIQMDKIFSTINPSTSTMTLEKCQNCNGTGGIPCSCGAMRCEICKGTGKIKILKINGQLK